MGKAVRRHGNNSYALFLLRLSLGLFLALWALNKIISPDSAAALFSQFYFTISEPLVIVSIGIFELILSIFFICGIYKNITYSLALFIQVAATLASLKEITDPFGKNIFFVAHIPLLCAFMALFLLRRIDSRWTLTKKPKMFS
jgi:hypothetical protein